MNGTLGIVGAVLGGLCLLDVLMLISASLLSSRISRAEERGETPRLE